MQGLGFGAAIDNLNLNQNVFCRLFSIFNKHVEITAFVEYARIEQLKFGL